MTTLSGFSVLKEYFNSYEGAALGKDSILYSLVQLSPSPSFPASDTPAAENSAFEKESSTSHPLLTYIVRQANETSLLTASGSNSWALPLLAAASMPQSEVHPLSAVTCALSLRGPASLMYRVGVAAASPVRAPQLPAEPQPVAQAVGRMAALAAVAAMSPPGSALRILFSATKKASRAQPPSTDSSEPLVVARVASNGREQPAASAPPKPSALNKGASARYELTSTVAALGRSSLLTAFYRQVCIAPISFAVNVSASTATAVTGKPPIGTAAVSARPPAAPQSKPPADPRPKPLRPPKHTSSPFQYHSRCSGGALGFAFAYAMALEADKPPLIATLTGQASAPPRDVEAAKLATIAAVRSGRSVSDADRTIAAASATGGSQLSSSAASYVPLGGQHQLYFFGLRCLHDAIGLIQAASPIPIYTRVLKETAWTETSTKDTVALANGAAEVSNSSSRSRNPSYLPPVKHNPPTPQRDGRQAAPTEMPVTLLPARPKGTAQRINRRIEVLQAEIMQLVRAQEERAARNVRETQKRQSPRAAAIGGSTKSDDDKSQKNHQWMQPHAPLSLNRRESNAPGGDAATPQRPTMPPPRRGSISQCHALAGGLDDAVVTRAAAVKK